MTKEAPRTSVLRDAELIAQLREYREINEGSTGVSYDPIPECLAAADRIELLATTNEQLVATNETLSISNATLIAEKEQYWHSFVFWRAEADGRTEQLKISEAKLAENEVRLGKAVELLKLYVDIDDVGGCERATLAELKGESHE